MTRTPDNRVYFDQGWFGRGSRIVKTEQGTLNGIDGSFLQFLVEELLALSARRIVVPERSHAGIFAGSLPKPYSDYVEVVDTGPIISQARRVFHPVWEEFGVHPTPKSIDLGAGLSGEDLDALITLFDGIHGYLCGVKYGASIGVDLARLRRATIYVRSKARSADARVILARFEGFLACYAEIQVPHLSWASQGPREHVRAFRELMEDQEYVQLCTEAHFLGVPARAKRAAQLVTRWTRKILEKARFAELFSLGAKTLQTAALPLPSASNVLALFGSDYAPPVIDFTDTLDRATLGWLESDAPFIAPPTGMRD